MAAKHAGPPCWDPIKPSSQQNRNGLAPRLTEYVSVTSKRDHEELAQVGRALTADVQSVSKERDEMISLGWLKR